MAVDLYRQKQHSIQEVCQMLDISNLSVYAYVGDAEEKVGQGEE